MEYQNVLEFIGKDRTNIYKVTDYGEWPVRHDDLSQAQPGMYYLFHPLLSYGDYDDSTDIQGKGRLENENIRRRWYCNLY
jgi:hypothetical protein